MGGQYAKGQNSLGGNRRWWYMDADFCKSYRREPPFWRDSVVIVKRMGRKWVGRKIKTMDPRLKLLRPKRDEQKKKV